MSSAAATRTSTGTAIRQRLRSTRSTSSRSTSRPCSRGTAYSISSKRTRRGEAKTRWDRSLNSRAPSARPRPAPSAAPAAAPGGRRRPGRRRRCWTGGRRPTRRRSRESGCEAVGERAGVVLGEDPAGVREPVELDVVGALDVVVEAVRAPRRARRGPRARARRTPARPAASRSSARRARRGRPGPRRSTSAFSVSEVSSVEPSGSTSSSATTWVARPPKRSAGAVGAGRDRAGDRLLVDVAEVGEREPEVEQRAVEPAQRDPGLDGDPAGAAWSTASTPVEVVEAQLHVERHPDAGERVAGADRAHPAAVGGGVGQHCGELVAVARRDDLDAVGALVARPVAPAPSVLRDTPAVVFVPLMVSQHARLEAATQHLDAPVAVVDLEAFDANAADLVRRAAGMPVRVASKSVRCRALLRRALGPAGFAGVLAFTVAEALWLAEEHEDVVVGYPSAERAALAPAGRRPGGRRAGDADDRQRRGARAVTSAPPTVAAPLRVCLDLDASLRLAGGRVHLGTRRSPRAHAADAVALARAVAASRRCGWSGLLAYEGQVAGLADRGANPVRAAAVRRVKAASVVELAERRGAVVAAVARGRRPRVRQRRRHRLARDDRRRPLGHRGGRRLRAVRAGAVRRLRRLRPPPRGLLRPRRLSAARRPAWSPSPAAAGSPPARSAATGSRCRPTPRGCGCWRPRAPARCRPRSGGAAADGLRPRRPGLVPARQGRRAVRARRRAAPRRRPTAGRPTSCRPTAARAAPSPDHRTAGNTAAYSASASRHGRIVSRPSAASRSLTSCSERGRWAK